jgi:hypothetical protein
MSSGYRMIRKICVVMATFAVLMGASMAVARDYTRSCNASITVVNRNRNMTTVVVESFSASATSSSYMPNTLRLRAYRRANSCFDWAWPRRNESAIPEGCRPSNGISGYDVTNLSRTLSRLACREWSMAPRSRTRVDVWGRIWGQKGCGGSRRKTSAAVKLADNYAIYCN